MSRASDAYAVLTEAMVDTDPACQNDSRFVADDQPADELAPICNACPLLELCATYGDLERPKAGIWAARRYRTNQPRRAAGEGVAK
jgi:hypothetical protein